MGFFLKHFLLLLSLQMCEPENLGLTASLICLVVTLMDLKNIEYHEDGSMDFSLFSYVSFVFIAMSSEP